MGSNNPSDAAAGPPPWLRRGSVSSIPPRSTRSIVPSAGRTDELAGALRSTVLRVARQLHEEREKRTAMEASVEAHKFQAEALESTSLHLTKRVEELQLEATQLARLRHTAAIGACGAVDRAQEDGGDASGVAC